MCWTAGLAIPESVREQLCSDGPLRTPKLTACGAPASFQLNGLDWGGRRGALEVSGMRATASRAARGFR
jgi:hypothetical protein